MKLWLDTESVGLCGATKLIQFAVDDGPVQFISLYRNWLNDVDVVRELTKLFTILDSPTTMFYAFNSSFDLFALYKLRHMLHGYASTDGSGRTFQPFGCGVTDLQVAAMLKSELSPFAFSRGRVRSIAAVRRIPKVATDYVRDLVESRLRPHIPEFFKLNCSERRIAGRPELTTLAWSVEGSLSLKNLARVWGLPTIQLAEVWPLPDRGTEKPWLPYPDPAVHDRVEVLCEEVMRNPNSAFWAYSKLDILLLRYAYEKLGKPMPDIHSENAHCVAYTRFCGFELDRNALSRSIDFYQRKVDSAASELSEEVLKSAPKRLALLRAVDPLVGSSKKSVLLGLAESDRPSAELARKMVSFGPNRQRLLQLQKVAESVTGRAHPDRRVMGTATLRESGTAGLNWHGVGQAEFDDLPPEPVDDLGEDEAANDDEPEVDDQIAEDVEVEAKAAKVGLRTAILSDFGGDWSSFEVVLASAIYPDASMLADLKAGLDPHTQRATEFHPEVIDAGLDYAGFIELRKQKNPWAEKIRKTCKGVSFCLQYFGAAQKIANTMGSTLAEAQAGLERYYARYQGFAAFRRTIEHETQTADTTHWSADSVGRMARESTDLTGHVRRWDFEADVADTLWRLAKSAIRSGHSGSIVRTVEKGAQSIDMAITSALYGGALAIQAAVTRQRGNTPVQMSGACIHKSLMATLWRKHRVPMLGVHDEIVFGRHPNTVIPALTATIDEFVAEWSKKVPELRFDYKKTERWSDK